MINDKLFLIIVSMLVLIWGCAAKPQVKLPEVTPPEEKPIISTPEEKAVAGEESRLEPAPQPMEPEAKPVPQKQETIRAETTGKGPVITKPKKKEKSAIETALETVRIGTLDFHEEKLCNVLKVISYMTGVNFMVEKEIFPKEKGQSEEKIEQDEPNKLLNIKVTIFLKNVNVRTALDVLCNQNGLSYKIRDGYIVIRDKRDDFIISTSDGVGSDADTVIPDRIIKAIDFRGMPLFNALRKLSRVTGKNIVCKGDEDLACLPIHLVLKDVSVKTVVEVICKEYDLWYTEDKDENYICLMPAKEFGKDMAVDYKAKIRVFNLKYASAPQLADSIACVMGNRVEYTLPVTLGSYEHLKYPDLKEEKAKIQEAKIEADITKQIPMPKFQDKLTSEKIEELISAKLDLMLTAKDLRWINKEIGFALMTIFLRNNAIIACSTDDTILKEIGALIEKLDTPTPQVLIECRILSVNLTDDFTSFFQITNFAHRKEGGESYGEDTKIWEAPFFGAAGANVLYNFVEDKWKLDATLKLLKGEGILNVVASPMIVAAQNTQAEATVGLVNFPFFTGFEYVEPRFDEEGNLETAGYTAAKYELAELVGTELKITPQINQDRSVTLRLYVEQSSVEEAAATVLYTVFDKEGTPLDMASVQVDVKGQNTVNTIVVVPGGQTLALGGLVEERDSVTESKIPFLGDIPLIGFFFKDHKTEKRRKETVFLLTPHIMMAPEEAGAVSEKALEGIQHPVVKEGKKNLFEFDEERKKLRRVE